MHQGRTRENEHNLECRKLQLEPWTAVFPARVVQPWHRGGGLAVLGLILCLLHTSTGDGSEQPGLAQELALPCTGVGL